MSSPRQRRVVLVIWAVLFASLVVAIAFVRHGRHQFDAPLNVRGPVWRLHGPVSDFYAARAGDHVLLFDSGADPEGRGLDALLAAMHARRDDVSDVFLTHGHGDHVAAAPLASRARVHAGQGDVDMMAQKSPTVPLLARYMRFILPTPKVEARDAISARSEIQVDGAEKVIAIPFPGHTPGSTIYFYAGVLFAGDAINFEGDKLTLAFPPFTVDKQLNRRNVSALGTFIPLDQIKVVCTGHSGCTPEADTRRMLDDVINKARS